MINDFSQTLLDRINGSPMLNRAAINIAYDGGHYRKHVVADELESWIIKNFEASHVFPNGYDNPTDVVGDWIKLGIQSVYWQEMAEVFMDEAYKQMGTDCEDAQS